MLRIDGELGGNSSRRGQLPAAVASQPSRATVAHPKVAASGSRGIDNVDGSCAARRNRRRAPGYAGQIEGTDDGPSHQLGARCRAVAAHGKAGEHFARVDHSNESIRTNDVDV